MSLFPANTDTKHFTLLRASSCRSPSLTHRFRPGQGQVLYPQIGDKMDIVCPRADASSGGKEEFYRIYLVSRSQMESCTIDKKDAPLLNCDKPHQDVKFTFKFQEFSPNLWGLEFLKGRDYYITCESQPEWIHVCCPSVLHEHVLRFEIRRTKTEASGFYRWKSAWVSAS